MKQLRSLGPPGTEHQHEELAQKTQDLNKHLEKLGIKGVRFTVVQTNSIQSYFICESEEQLDELHEHYESGLMKDVLERIFSLLAGEQVNISLRWTTDEYQKSQQQFSALRSESLSQQSPDFPFQKLIWHMQLCYHEQHSQCCCFIRLIRLLQ